MKQSILSTNKKRTPLDFLFLLLYFVDLPFMVGLEILMMCGLFITKRKPLSLDDESYTLDFTNEDRIYLHIVGLVFSFSFYYAISKLFWPSYS